MAYGAEGHGNAQGQPLFSGHPAGFDLGLAPRFQVFDPKVTTPHAKVARHLKPQIAAPFTRGDRLAFKAASGGIALRGIRTPGARDRIALCSWIGSLRDESVVRHVPWGSTRTGARTAAGRIRRMYGSCSRFARLRGSGYGSPSSGRFDVNAARSLVMMNRRTLDACAVQVRSPRI